MVKYASGYLEKTPRRTLFHLRDPLTMDEFILDRLGLEYTRYMSDGLGKSSYTAITLSDRSVVSINHRSHQDGRIEYCDGKNTFGGIIEIEYDYGTWPVSDPEQFPEYEDLVKFVMDELEVEPHEILISSLYFCGGNYDEWLQSYRKYALARKDKYPRI